MTKIIYSNSDGTVSIITPTGDVELAKKDVPSGTAYEVVEDNTLPTDRTFRNAWIGNNIGIATATTTVTEDISKARDIHKANIRNARTPKLAALDIEFQKAQETSASTAEIVDQKRLLRDAPAASGIATAANTTELKAQWDTSILGTSPYS